MSSISDKAPRGGNSLGWRLALAVGVLILPVAVLSFRSWTNHGTGAEPKLAEVLEALNAGNHHPANAAIEVWQERFGFDSHVHLVRGALLLRSGEPDAALKEFAAVYPAGAVEQPAYLWTGECLYRLGRYADAERMFAKLASVDPKNVDAHRWLGAIYYDLGANDRAIGELKKVAELDLADYRSHRLIGLMCLDFGIADQAVDAYRQALKRSPPPEMRAEIIRELGRSLIQLHQYQEALDALRETPPDALSAALQAECFWSLGRRSEADERLQFARSLDPDHRWLLLLEARIALSEGKPQAVVESMQRALQADPHDAECRYQLALAYRDLGQPKDHERELAQWQRSRDLMARLTELNLKAIQQPANIGVRKELADVCRALGKHDLAKMWRKAVAGYSETSSP